MTSGFSRWRSAFSRRRPPPDQPAGEACLGPAARGRDGARRFHLPPCFDLLRRRRVPACRRGRPAWSREGLFWGGGHLLQFVYAALLITNWSILARMSLGEKRSTTASSLDAFFSSR